MPSKYQPVQNGKSSNKDKNGNLKTDWKSIMISNIVAFLGSVTMSSIIPTVWPYMKKVDVNVPVNYYGFIRGLYALGNIIFSMLSGFLSNKVSDTRPAMIIGKFVLISAALSYLLIEVFPMYYIYVFIGFELLLGASVGICNVYRTHIAMASTEADRSRAFGITQFATSTGIIAGPLLQAAFAQIRYPGIPLFAGIHFNLYTAPILLAAVTSAIGIYLLFCHFDGKMRIRDIPAPVYTEDVTLGTTDEDKFLEEPTKEEEKAPKNLPKYDVIAVIVLILVKITSELVILNLATVAPPYMMTAFEWTSEDTIFFQTIIMFSIGTLSICFALSYIFFKMGQRVNERTALSFALLLFLGFYLATYPWELWTERISYQHVKGAPAPENRTMAMDPGLRATISAALKPGSKIDIVGCNPEFLWCETTPRVNVWLYNIISVIAIGVGLPLIHINLDILYSKVLGPIKQGTLQGVFVATGQILNVVGPVIFSQLYTLYGPKILWGLEIIVCITALAMFFIFYSRVIPWSEMIEKNNKKSIFVEQTKKFDVPDKPIIKS
jgi:MFS family permease